MAQENLRQNFVLVALSGGLSCGNGSHGAVLKLLAAAKPITHDVNLNGVVACFSACPSGLKAVVALVKRAEYLRKTNKQFNNIGIGIIREHLPVSLARRGDLLPSFDNNELNRTMANAQGIQTYQATLDEIIDFIG